MKRAQLEQWINKLEDPNIKQGTSYLHQKNSITGEETFCCLGVYIHFIRGEQPIGIDDINGICRYPESSRSLRYPGYSNDFYSPDGHPSNYPDKFCLANMNDDGKTFKEIAQILRDNPTEYVKLED